MLYSYQHLLTGCIVFVPALLSLLFFPPALCGQGAVQLYDFADPWGGNTYAELVRPVSGPVDGLAPWMQRQLELAPVYGHKHFSFQIDAGLYGVLGLHMYIGPLFVVLAAFQQGQIEGTEFIADSFEGTIVPRVAAEEEFIACGLQYEGCP